jgi:hypothetical protein
MSLTLKGRQHTSVKHPMLDVKGSLMAKGAKWTARKDRQDGGRRNSVIVLLLVVSTVKNSGVCV